MTSRHAARFLVFAFAAGCAAPKGDGAPPVTPPAPAAPVTTASAPPAADPVPAVPPAPPMDFHVVARITSTEKPQLGLQMIDGTVLLTTGDRLFPIQNGALVRDDSFSRGLELGWTRSLVGLGGHYPEPAFATILQAYGRTGMGAVVRREKGVWTQTSLLAQSVSFLDAQPWDRGRTLALTTSMFGEASDFVIVDGPKGGAVPKLSPKNPVACKDWRGTSEIVPSSFLAFGSGEVYVAGTRCDESGPAIEVFAAGARRGVIVAVPKSERCERVDLALAGVRPDGAFVRVSCAGPKGAADERLLSFDGKAFHEISMPDPGSPVVSRDGALFLVSDTLKRRNADGTWTALTFPGTVLQAVRIVSATDIWMLADDALLHTGPATGEPQDFAVPAQGAQMTGGSARAPRAATPSCESPYVLLYGFTRTTPADYDFPLTRKAIKGHDELQGTRFVVTKDGGKKYFGAFPPSFDAGKKLVALVQKQVKDSSPQLLCVKPEEEREIKIDLKTGEVVK